MRKKKQQQQHTRTFYDHSDETKLQKNKNNNGILVDSIVVGGVWYVITEGKGEEKCMGLCR